MSNIMNAPDGMNLVVERKDGTVVIGRFDESNGFEVLMHDVDIWEPRSAASGATASGADESEPASEGWLAHGLRAKSNVGSTTSTNRAPRPIRPKSASRT